MSQDVESFSDYLTRRTPEFDEQIIRAYDSAILKRKYVRKDPVITAIRRARREQRKLLKSQQT